MTIYIIFNFLNLLCYYSSWNGIKDMDWSKPKNTPPVFYKILDETEALMKRKLLFSSSYDYLHRF